VVAAVLEVWGDQLVRQGLETGWGRVVAGGFALAFYGVAVNVWWRGDFSQLLGVYVVIFFLMSQLWGVAFFGERLDAPRLAGGALIVAGGAVVQWWRPG